MSPTNSSVIESIGLSKTYGNVSAVSGINLTVNSGEKIALIGPNGSGKSTLIKLFSTLIRPTTGMLNIFGHPAQETNAVLRKKIGVLLHDTLIYDRLTALENLTFYAKMFHVEQRTARINVLAECLSITELLGVRVEQLSHGQKKRISLLRTLLHDPPLLLLDEPDAGLDHKGLETLLRIVAEDGRTVVMSTHNFDTGLSMANRVIALGQGKTIVDCDKDDLRQSDLKRIYDGLTKK